MYYTLMMTYVLYLDDDLCPDLTCTLMILTLMMSFILATLTLMLTYVLRLDDDLQVLPDLGPTSSTSSLDSDPNSNSNKASGPLATTSSSVGSYSSIGSLSSYSSIGSLDEERRSALGSAGLRESDVVLTDETTGWQRAVVVLGYNVALYLVAQAWLWAR